MKKILTIAIFYILSTSYSAYSQSNLTWTIKDHMEKGAIKTTTVFNSNFSGFVNKQEAISFCQKLKAYSDVASCDIITNSGTSSDMKLVMKRSHDKQYIVGFATKVGIGSIQVNGNKKTTAELLNKKK